MKKRIPLFLLATLPALAWAGGEHAGHGHADGSAATPGEVAASPAGRPGKAAEVTRTIEVAMGDDLRFMPDRFQAKAGETVRFFVRNTGKVRHEFVIGTMDELKAHAEMMRRMPDMEHNDPALLSLKPGQRGALIWKFDRPGIVDIACLVPGHLEAGMSARVAVEN